MKRLLYSSPEPFSLSPLLSLLPVMGKMGELEKLTASLYARYEKAAALKESLNTGSGQEGHQRIFAEEAMLKQILEWLSVNTDLGGKE